MGELYTKDNDKMQDNVDKIQKLTVQSTGRWKRNIYLIRHKELKNDDYDGIFARRGRSRYSIFLKLRIG